ncbi:MAG: RNA pyrophosphohydrolase [Alphaproteobacteria bacterium]|nr:RNA pyrophosphohydrolase [Alphaproteobacteria bacterium]
MRSDRPDSRHYRLCAGAVLFSQSGKVWVGQRIDTPDAWQMPQGGIDAGEDPAAAALRELHEETGSDNVALLAQAEGWLTYDLPPALAAQAWGGKYRGQMQKWFAFRFLGRDDQIDIHGVEKPEFAAWQWVDIDEVAGLIVDFKRPVYEAVVAEFQEFARI